MISLNTRIPYPKTKMGTFFLSLTLSFLLPIIIFSLYNGTTLLSGSQLSCGTIDYTKYDCNFIETFTMQMATYFIWLTPLTLGATIFVPTLGLWIFLDLFRRRSVPKHC